jgi:hypothetical protein
MSSEELTQRGLTKKGITIVDYEFFPLHSTTLKQYKKSKPNDFMYLYRYFKFISY